jgi:hypothetical protein
MACQANKMACKPFGRAWAGDASQIHAPARNKPFGTGASQKRHPHLRSINTHKFVQDISNIDVGTLKTHSSFRICHGSS